MSDQVNQLAAFQPRVTSAVLALKAASNSFFPSLRVAAGESKAVKLGFIQPGELYIATQDPKFSMSLGRWEPAVMGKKDTAGCHVDVINGPWRPHALLLNNQEVQLESFVEDSPDFQRIKGTEQVGQDIVPMIGTDVLYYIDSSQINIDCLNNKRRGLTPEQIAVEAEKYKYGIVAVLFFAKTAAQYSTAFGPEWGGLESGQPFTLSTGLIETKRYSWYVPGGRTLLNKENVSYYNNGIQALLDAAPKFIEVTNNQTLDEGVHREGVKVSR